MIKIHTNQDILLLELVTKHEILNLNLVIKKVFGSKNKCHFLVFFFFVLTTTLYMYYGGVEGPDKKKISFFRTNTSYLFGRVIICSDKQIFVETN